MIVHLSHASRAALVRLGRGEALHESLVTIARAQNLKAATVTGHGVLQSVTLDSYDPRTRSWGERRTFAGSIELLSLSGHVTHERHDPELFLHATVSRETDNGLEVLGGRLLDAQIVAVELTMIVHEDVMIERVPDPSTGIDSWHIESHETEGARATPPTPPAAPPPPVVVTRVERGTSERPPPRERAVTPPKAVPAAPSVVKNLADAARQLEAMPARYDRTDLDAGAEVAVGDLLEHPTWSLCEIVREPEPGLYDIRILDKGNHRTIKIDVFQIEARPPRDGRRVWRLKPRTQR